MAIATRPRPSAHARKRQGGHHRRDKHYMKSYWPYLPMLLIVGLGLLVNGLWTTKSVLSARSGIDGSSLLAETNAERAAQGDTPLTLNHQLATAAQAKAEDMVRADYWSHNSPDGKTPWSFITAAGYTYAAAGENLAYGFASAHDSVSGWMNSPEHRANMLDNKFQDVGFGVAASPNYQGEGQKTVVVAEYGQPVQPGVPGAAPSGDVLGASTDVAARPVSRIEVLTGNESAWSLLAVVALTSAAMATFMIRYGFKVHRLLGRGEAFIAHHPYLDIAIVFIITAGVILTRSSGIIR